MARLLWICGAPHVGGAEHVTLALLDALGRRGHAVTALTASSRVAAAAAARGFDARVACLRGPARLLGLLPIRRTLTALAPAVTLVTTSDEWVTTCLARQRRHATTLVLVRHMVLRLPGPVRFLAGRRADAVVAVSHAARAALLAAPGIPPPLVHVLPNPVRFPVRTTVPSACLRTAARTALGLVAPGHWVGFFGGSDPPKGLADVMQAIADANRRLGPTNLLLGDPHRGQAVRIPAALRDRVYPLPDPERMVDALTAVDLVVGATRSTLGEALPATLMEAMALGTPVVAYATGGVPEVIGTDGVSGQLVRPDDRDALAAAVSALLADAVHRDRLAAAALDRIRAHFDPDATAAAYEALFDDLMGTRRTRP